MSQHLQTQGEEIRALADKLAADGWDRLRGLRLVHAVSQIGTHCQSLHWTEASGRVAALTEVLGEFLHEAPTARRLAATLRAVEGLADLLGAGPLASAVDTRMLPAQPDLWRFLIIQGAYPNDAMIAAQLTASGFIVDQLAPEESLTGAAHGNRVVLAPAGWLAANAQRLTAIVRPTSAENVASPQALWIVAIADTTEFRTQMQARQAGARLIADRSGGIARLIAELSGLAWMPRDTYRVLMVDDDASMLNLHASILRGQGFEVLATTDPVAALDFIAEFAPDACVLDVEMPACLGTDLAALLRRDERFARLPILYLSAHDDLVHQLAARQAGGEDYLLKPIDPRLLSMAVLARVRQCRTLRMAERHQQALHQELEHLRQALDAHAAVSVASTDGVILDANPKFSDISGYRHDELIGRDHRIVKSGHHSAAFYADMWQTIAAGHIWQGEVQNRRKDGQAYWAMSTVVPIPGEDGKPSHYISLRTDITEQKRVQAAHVRQERLLDLLRQAAERFAGNPDITASSALLLDGMLSLTDSAYGFIGELLYDPDGTPYLRTHAISDIAWDEDSRRIYDEAQTNGLEFRKLDTLYGQVLQTGKRVIANEPASDPRRGGTPPGHPPLEAFLGVPVIHGEVLIGMVGLANRPGGYDEIVADTVQTITATYANLLEAARLRQVQQMVVEELQQALHQAQAQRQVQPALPAESVPESAAVATVAVAAKRTANRCQILVAEDNPANQAALRMQLDALGYTADIAGDGAAALAKWQTGQHALVLADRNMPRMDGLELTRAIRASEKAGGARIPIIGITAASEAEEIALCRQAGMDDVLLKPIELMPMSQLLARWLPDRSATQLATAPTHGAVATVVMTLDIGHITRIVGHASSTQVRELVDLFTMTARGDLPACRQYLAAHNGRDLALLMHKLKSSAALVGALRFAELAEALENAAEATRLVEAAALYLQLEIALTDVETAVVRLAVPPAPTFSDGESAAAIDVATRHKHVLLVDDDPVVRRQISTLLTTLGMVEVCAVESAQGALDEIARVNDIDLLICDLRMPDIDGIELLRRIDETCEQGWPGEVILISGVDTKLLQTTADLVRTRGMKLLGALKKPVTRDNLLDLLTRERQQAKKAYAAQVQPEITADDILEGIRNDEFTVHFQPKVNAGSLQAIGVEALARWTRQGRAIPPNVFIPLAERHDLIGPLSELLITKAFVGGARLADSGFPLSVAVNLSASWLTDLRLADFIRATAQATGLRAESIILEVTESSLMADQATALDILNRLRLMGCRLAIDDFGTGYSSLEQLQRIPFSELKIDRSFVHAISSKQGAQDILATSIDMAHKLNLTTVAEGVETQDDLDLVRGLGCELVQGWFIDKAMPIDVLIPWLQARRAAQ